MLARHLALVITLTLTLASSTANAASKNYEVKGRIVGGEGYAVLLVQKNGSTKSATVRGSGAFSLKRVKLSQLKSGTLQLIDPDGRYAGPVVLGRKGSKASITFSGKAGKSSVFNLGNVTLRDGYAAIKRNRLRANTYNRPRIPTSNGKPSGAGELGLVQTTQTASRLTSRAEGENPGSDLDQDGIPSAFDVDDDGDLVLDASDPDSQGADIPYTNLVFDFRKTLNAHVRSGLTDELIDSVIGGENVFSLTFFFSLPPNQSNIDGGFIDCDDSLVYCRRNDPVGFYGGIVESSDEFKNRPWSELLNSDGYPRMEKINVSGFPAIVASIQPRVGRSQFRPGDAYRVNLTAGSRVVSTRSLALAPYFVSIPALKDYNPGTGTTTVDYNSVTAESGSIPGVVGNPIVLSGDGLLTVSFWRPQRQALGSSESGFVDWGNLNYGIILENAQATCAGLYSGLSADFQEDPDALGDGGSPLAQNGASLSPLRDTMGDRAANVDNMLSLTVNLKGCAARAGLSPGTYTVNLRAAGEELSNGQITAVQSFSVQIP